MDKIIVRRKGLMSGEGTLSYLKDRETIFETACWEDATNLIPAKEYTGCSKTTMVEKQKEAIFLPDDQTGKKGIFIHEGRNQLWSDGCICIVHEMMNELIASVSSEKGSITVLVLQT